MTRPWESPGGRRARAVWVPWLLLAASVAVDWTVLQSLKPFGQAPDAVLASALVFAALGRERLAVAMGLLGGVLSDVLSGTLVGLGGVSRGVAAWAVARAGSRLEMDSYGPVLLAVALGAVLERGLGALGAWAFGLRVGLSLARVLGGLVHVLLTTGAFAVLYPIATWLSGPGDRPSTRDLA